MIESFAEYLKTSECAFRENYSLGNESSMRIDTVVRLVIYPENAEKLTESIKRLRELSIPHRVLGRMTNVLFKDPIYNGVIIKTDKFNQKYVAESKITFECGAKLLPTVRELAEINLGGFEGVWGIPGSIGGMVRQNAGAFGYEIADRLKECTVLNTVTAKAQVISASEMLFSYRSSLLYDQRFVLLSATFDAIDKPRERIFAEVEEYSSLRRCTQPLSLPSLGSVFKRNAGVGAGYYIDKCGLKGYRVGGAVVSEKHAGFILNLGNATAYDVLLLIEIIKDRVFREFGITLEEEIEII